MTTAARFIFPYQTAIDGTGATIPGALLNFYLSGTDTRANTYSNAGLTIANANPVVAGADGTFPNIFLQPIAYKVVLTDADGAEIWTADPVTGIFGLGSPKIVYSSEWPTLAQADAAAVTAGAQLYIDQDWTLAGNTILNAPLVYGAGGVIHLATHNLTITNALDGANDQVIDVGTGAGTLSILGGNVIKGLWVTGPYGNASVDYLPALQALFNIVFRYTTPVSGPRVLDLSGGGDQQSPGLYLSTSIVVPPGALGGCVEHYGQCWQMNADNTPFFIFNTNNIGNNNTEGWSFFGSPYSCWKWQNAQLSTATSAVVFMMDAVGSSNGHHSFEINGGIVAGGYGLIGTKRTGSSFNGFWGFEIANVGGYGISGSFIYHQPPTGGAERQYYNNIKVVGAAQSNVLFDIANAPGLEINQWSIDGVGVGVPGATTAPIISILQCNDFKLTQGHIENIATSFNFGGLIDIISSEGDVDGIDIALWNIAAAKNQAIVNATNGSSIFVDNVDTHAVTLGAASAVTLVRGPSPGDSTVEIGRRIILVSEFSGAFNGGVSAGNSPEQYLYEGELPLGQFWADDVETLTGETDLAASGSSIAGTPNIANGFVSRLAFTLSDVIAGGSIALKVYDGASLLGTVTMNNTTAIGGILFMPPIFAGTTWPVTLGNNLRITVTASGVSPPALNLQVSPSILVMGDS